jgi:hypothetical protein
MYIFKQIMPSSFSRKYFQMIKSKRLGESPSRYRPDPVKVDCFGAYYLIYNILFIIFNGILA